MIGIAIPKDIKETVAIPSPKISKVKDKTKTKIAPGQGYKPEIKNGTKSLKELLPFSFILIFNLIFSKI